MIELLDLLRVRLRSEARSGRGVLRIEVAEQEREQDDAEHHDDRLCDSPYQVAGHCSVPALPPSLSVVYFVKYQFSGLMFVSAFSGVTPWSFLLISVAASWIGCQTTGSCLAP